MWFIVQILLCFDFSQPSCSRDLSPGAFLPSLVAVTLLDGCSAEAAHIIAVTLVGCFTPCVVGTVFENQGGARRRRRRVCMCASLFSVSRCMNSESSENGDECYSLLWQSHGGEYVVAT